MAPIRLPSLLVLLVCLASQADEKTLTLVAEDYPPFTDSRIASKGWTYAVVKAAMERQGYKTELTLVPWARALAEAKMGKYDGLLNAYWSEERLEHFQFSAPIGEVRARLYKLKKRSDLSYKGDLKPLANLLIGVVRGYTISEEFDKADFLQRAEVPKTENGLAMLYSGRIDLLASGDLADGSNILALLERQWPGIKSNVVALDPPLSLQYLHVAVSRAAPQAGRKLEELNIGLRKILLDGSYQKILKAHGVAIN